MRATADSPGDLEATGRATGFRSLLVLAGFGLVLLSAGSAHGDPRICGPICSQPGRYVACNDDLSFSGGPSSANCSASLGSCTGEAFCASFSLPSSLYPLTIHKIAGLFAPTAAADQFDIEVYEEQGGAEPGMPISPSATNSYGIPGNTSSLVEIDVSAASFRITSGDFRVCFRKQFDESHNVCLDSSNPPNRRNWMYAGVALSPPCGNLIASSWQDAAFWQLFGDFVIRPTLEVADLSPWQPGGVCGGRPEDAGPRDMGVDAGGLAIVDTGVESDAGPPPTDGGSADGSLSEHEDARADAMSGWDAAAAQGDADSAETGGHDAGRWPAPKITALDPSEASNDVPTPVVVVGTGFRSGLHLHIGPIAATDVSVSGDTTIAAVIPPSIAPGVYAVRVTNPDGQADLRPMGLTITGKGQPSGGGAPRESGCACTSHSSEASNLGLALFVGLVVTARRRIRSREER